MRKSFTDKVGAVGAALGSRASRRASEAAADEAEDRDGHISQQRRSSAASRGGCWFALPLDQQLCELDRGRRVPALLPALRRALVDQEGLEHEGIFRLSPEAQVIMFVKQRLDKGEEPEGVLHGCSCDVLAGLLKEYIRELPGGVWVSSSGGERRKGEKKRRDSVGEGDRSSQAELEAELLRAAGGGMPTALLLKQALGPGQREMLLWVLDLLTEVASREASNKMSKAALAAVFAPVLFPASEALPPLEQLQRAKDGVRLCKLLLDGHEAGPAASAKEQQTSSGAEVKPPLTRGASKRKAGEVGGAEGRPKLDKRQSSASSGGGSSTGLTPRLGAALQFSSAAGGQPL